MNLTTDKNTPHTPGPWRIKPEEHAAVILCDAFVVADVSYEAGVCAGASSKEEALANAQLIAAAPELLVALEQCVPLIIAHANYSGEGVSTLQVARLAIAQAKHKKSEPKKK